MKLCGAFSSTPGRNTNMNPPARLSDHSTNRTLVTLAAIVAAEHVETDRVADVDLELTR